MSAKVHARPETGPESACFPEFKRLKYSYGQMLGADDFQTEQAYFKEKQKLHNRCLHGYGTVCGLMVIPAPTEQHCRPEAAAERLRLEEDIKAARQEREQAGQQKEAQVLQELDARIEELHRKLDGIGGHGQEAEKCAKVRIECGLALDCDGNELILRRPLDLDIWHHLDQDDRNGVTEAVQGECDVSLYVSLCYCELPVDPMRPVVADTCGATSGCIPGKLLDTVRVRITAHGPSQDPRCETCCDVCGDPCLLLARIDNFRPGEQLTREQIQNGVRRLVDTPYPYATIKGIGWEHGAEYPAIELTQMLREGGDGLKVEFSRPVLKSTLTRGVVELWMLQGGKGRHGDIYNVDAHVTYDGDGDKPATDWMGIHWLTTDNPDPGDRLLIIIRAAFILDECCRPVDGAHVGGRVPGLSAAGTESDCLMPLPGYGPWTSGTGYPGANFESWLYVAESEIIAKSSRTQE